MNTFDVIKTLCKNQGISVSSLERDLGYGNGSLAKAKVIPSDRIYEIAKYFNVRMEYLMGEVPSPEENYYYDEETRDMAQAIFENKELRILFDAARDSSPEDLQTVHSMLLALKRKEQGNIDE